MTNTLEQLTAAGVSIWLDDLSRNRIKNGSLSELIEKYSVRGVTTNPSIFANAISQGSESYRAQIKDCAEQGFSPEDTIRLITTDDVRSACDLFTGVFEQTNGIDGRVSIEVDPRLAHDTAGTVLAAQDLWNLVGRQNLFIKIPATDAGIPAITAVIAQGISVNVTLIFSVDRYRQVIEAYTKGLEGAAAAGIDLKTIASVASFFISRVDSVVDAALDSVGLDSAQQSVVNDRAQQSVSNDGKQRVRGSVAIANACIAWKVHVDSLKSARWNSLSGAQIQRPLWASTGVKDPLYPDTRYVIDLVAPGCVNTMPESTLLAVADHGVFLGDTVSDRAAESESILEQLPSLGISLPQLLSELEADGVKKFASAWSDLIAVVDRALQDSSQ